METQVITIVLETSIDASELLDMAIAMAQQLKDEIEDYGEEVILDTNEVTVECE